MINLKKPVIYILVLAPNLCFSNSDFLSCKSLFHQQVSPKIVSKKIGSNTYNFCYSDFAVSYSGISKTGIWSAEYISPQKLKMAKQFPREDNFKEETRVPERYRAKLSDYRGSGYDRGHLSASAQRSSREAQSDSFMLTNIFPQASSNNQGLWAEIEKATRSYIKKTNQSAYIITGTLFLGPKLKAIGNGLLVPTHVYKVVYFPTLDVVGAYVAVNDNSGRVDTVSLNQLQNNSGVVFFPTRINDPLFNMRFDLPMTPNDVSKIKYIQKKQSNQSQIFAMLPNNSVGSNQKAKQQYVENRNVAADLGKGMASELKDVGLNLIRKILY